jgi:hypothetical protein
MARAGRGGNGRASVPHFALVDRLQAAVQRRHAVTQWRTHIVRPDGRATLCGQVIGEHDTKHWTHWSTTWTQEQLGRPQSQWPLCKRCFGKLSA